MDQTTANDIETRLNAAEMALIKMWREVRAAAGREVDLDNTDRGHLRDRIHAAKSAMRVAHKEIRRCAEKVGIEPLTGGQNKEDD